MNKKFEEMYGWTSEEVVGKVLPMIPEDFKKEAFQFIQQIIQGEEFMGMEAIKLRKDGSSFYADVTISPVKNEEGDVIAFIGVGRDITEKKKAEEELKASEERYRVLVECSPEPIVVYQDSMIVFVNPAAVKLIGAENPAELIGEYVSRFLYPDDLAVLPEQLRRLFNAGKASDVIEKRLIRIDGKVSHVEVRAVPIEFQRKLSVQLLFRDVTDRIKAESELAEREKEYRRVLKLSPEPIILHHEGIIDFINDKGINLFNGENSEDFVGQSIFDFFSPSCHPIIVERMNNVIQTDDFMDFMELKLQRLDGIILDVEVSSISIYKHIGYPLIQIVIRDLTERKKTEELIRRSEKLSVVGQLAAGVAHEIRNPLTSLKGFMQLLKANNTDYVEIMMVELDQINNIVNEFMSIAKPHAMNLVESDIQTLIENVVIFMQPQALLFNAQMKLVKDSDLHSIQCDPNQIKQVLMNILKNAIESMPHGGLIEISVRTNDNGNVIIRVIDHGVGIPEDRLAKVGEPFFSMKENGTGLGLLICYRIIESHKWKMSIHSKINQGTAVEIEIPRISK